MSVRLGEPARPRREHRGVDVEELGSYVAQGKVADDVLFTDGTVDVLLLTTTHPSEL